MLQYNLILFYYVCIRFLRKYMLTDPPQLARLLADQSVKNQIVNNIIDNIIKLKLSWSWPLTVLYSVHPALENQAQQVYQYVNSPNIIHTK